MNRVRPDTRGVLLVCLLVLGSGLAGWEVSASGAVVRDGAVVRNTLWDVQVELEEFEPSEGDPTWGPEAVILAAESPGRCALDVGIYVSAVPDGATPEECRRDSRDSLEELGKSRLSQVHEHGVEPITYTLYDHRTKKPRVVTSHLSGYWTRRDQCFELRVSADDCDGFAEQAMPILRSVEIGEDNGVTLETVAAGERMGMRPDRWEVHETVAGDFLYEIDPPVPHRARRFYESARQLGGEEIPQLHLWLIEDGIGRTWLFEDDGEKALPHLQQALKIGLRTEHVEQTVYNIACAWALQGYPDAACQSLRRLLSSVGEERWGETVEQIRADPQLEPVVAAECFGTVLRNLGIEDEAGERGE
jgi:hypothetical protein